MTDFGTLLVSGSNPDEIAASVARVYQALPEEVRKRFHNIRRNYILWYGPIESLNRLNNRTVSQIFSEFRPLERKPLAAGETDGMRYELHDAPPPDEGEKENGSG
jgi:hypothetical protein